MKRNPNTIKLTKEFIESKVSQEEIVSTYLDIPIETINKCINENVLIKSVFRNDDNNGSLGFQYNNKGRLKIRDFCGIFFGDVYDVVAYVLSLANDYRLDVSKKHDFYYVLKHISLTFSDRFNEPSNVDTSNDIKCGLNKVRDNKSIIEIVHRNWNIDDRRVWEKWGIDITYLNTHFVYPVDQYYINRFANPEPKYYYSKKDPCYAYLLGITSKGIYNFKLYFPLRNHNTQVKFITNCNCLEGLPNLELFNYDYIIITKSSKDRLSIGNHLLNNSFYGGAGNKLVIGVINLPSENYQLKQNEYDYLLSKIKSNGMIISLLDSDATGRRGAIYLKQTYNIPYLFITRGEMGLYDYKAKDFAELKELYNDDVINNYIRETITYVELKYKLNNDSW